VGEPANAARKHRPEAAAGSSGGGAVRADRLALSAASPAELPLHLQRNQGNHAVSRLIAAARGQRPVQRKVVRQTEQTCLPEEPVGRSGGDASPGAPQRRWRRAAAGRRRSLRAAHRGCRARVPGSPRPVARRPRRDSHVGGSTSSQKRNIKGSVRTALDDARRSRRRSSTPSRRCFTRRRPDHRERSRR